MTYITPKEKDMLTLIIKSVLDIIVQHENDLKYIGYVMEVVSGTAKGHLMLYFKSKIPELSEISEISFYVDKIIDAIRAAKNENGEYDPKTLLGIRNDIAKSVLKKINDDVKPYLASKKSDELQEIRRLFVSLEESDRGLRNVISENGIMYTIAGDGYSIDDTPCTDMIISKIKEEMLRLIWENIRIYENSLKITASLCKENSKQLWCFNPTDYDQIRYCLIDPEPYIEKLRCVTYSNEFESDLSKIINEVTDHILKNYITPIKNLVVSNTKRSSTTEIPCKKPYHNQFDHKLVDFIKLVFGKGLNMEINDIYSIDQGNNCFEIHVLTNTDIRLKMFYLFKDSKAQIQLKLIRISQYYRGKGISKFIINNLFKYCSETGNTELLITDVINEDWEIYLRTKGAVLIKKDEQKGDALKIMNYI